MASETNDLNTLRPREAVIISLENIQNALKSAYVNVNTYCPQEISSLDDLNYAITECINEIKDSEQQAVWLYRLEFVITQTKGFLFGLQYHTGFSIRPIKSEIKLSLHVAQSLSLKLTPMNPPNLATTTSETSDHTPTFFAHQCSFDADKRFMALLSQVRHCALRNGLPTKKIFVSYAWPMGDIHYERWTAAFVDILVKHLIFAGLIVYQDKIHSGFGKNLDQFMKKKISTVDHIFFIVTATYAHKFNDDGCTGISNEYFLAIDRWRKNPEERLICPLLLTKKELPPFARRFSGIELHDVGYFLTLKEIFKKIYGFGENLDAIWNSSALTSDPREINASCVSAAAAATPAHATQQFGLFSSDSSTSFQVPALRSEIQPYKIVENGCIIELQKPIHTHSLDDLSHAISQSKENLTFASITGFPGSGKTVLAQSYIGHYKKTLPAIVTIGTFRAENKVTLREDYQNFAKALNIQVSDSMSLQVLKQNVEKMLEHRPNFLFVFDNVSDYEFIAEYIPSAKLIGLVIITLRDNLALRGKTFPVIHFDMASHLFTKEESLELLYRLTELPGDSHAEQLAVRLGYLPLALAQAGGYISRCEGTLSYKGYLDFFNHPNEIWSDERYFSPSEAYFRNYDIAINLSINQLQTLNSNLVGLLRFISLLNADYIPEFLLAKKVGQYFISELVDMRVKTWIQLLQKVSLVNRIKGEQAISIHRIIQTVANTRYNQEIKQSIDDAMSILIRLLDIDYRSLANWKKRILEWDNAVTLLVHAESILEHADKCANKDECFNRNMAKLLQLCAECYAKRSQSTEVEAKLKKALQICDGLNMKNDDNLAVYADIHLSKGRYLTWKTEAYDACIYSLTEAHKAMVKLYGENDPSRTLRAYGAIAVRHNFQKNHHLAIDIFRSLLRNPHLPKNDWQEAGYNHNLVELFFAVGDYESAKVHMSRSLEIYTMHNHPQINPVLNDLGRNYLKVLHDTAQAKEYFTKVVENHENDPQYLYVRPIYVAEAYYGLAEIAFQSNDITLSESYIIKIKQLDQQFSMRIYTHLKFKDFRTFEDNVTNQNALSLRR